MWQPVKIHFKNLFSHAETVFHFKLYEMCLLLAINEDSDGANSNGGGKSSIIEAICLAITGNVYRGVGKDEYIRTGEKSCVIDFTLRNSISNNVFLIHREIFISSKSAILDLSMNGRPIKEFSSENKMKRSAQEFIYDTLGIVEQDDFLNYFVIGEENDGSFFSDTDSKQKEVISRFSNYNKVEPIIETIKSGIRGGEEAVGRTEQGIEYKELIIANIRENLESLNDNSEFKARKESLEESIKNTKTTVASIKAKIPIVKEKVSDVESEIAVLKRGYKQKETLGQLEKKLSEIRKLKTSQEEVLNELSTIKSQLAVRNGKVVQCPKCKWEFIPGDDMTKKEIEESKTFVEQELEVAQITLENHQQKIQQVKESIKKAEQLEELDNSLISKIRRVKDIEQEFIDESAKLARYELELKGLKKTAVNQKLITEQTTKLDLYIKNLANDREVLQQLKINLEEDNFHLFSFSKQFKTFIANKTIRTIQDITNFYLAKFKINLRVLIKGYTLLKSGDIRDKITIQVIIDGITTKAFKALSKGEKARVKLCGVMAINKLVKNVAGENALDMLFVDELLEGLDVTGQNEVIRIMEESKITSLLVMHHAENAKAKNKVYVIKKNKISRLQFA